LKPGKILEKVNTYFGEKKLTHTSHKYIYTVFQVRPPGDAEDPFETNPDYCHYDETHNDYVYNENWANFLIHIIQSGVTINFMKEKFNNQERLDIEEYQP
jgi:hypothetical protein